MKNITAIIALALAVAFAGPAFAGAAGGDAAPATKADCEKAGGVWDAANNACAQQQQPQ
jgi:hypothetical protein